MFNFFRRHRHRTFDIAAIGDEWLVRPLTHDGIAGTLRIRQVPAGIPRKDFPLVALGWTDKALAPGDATALTATVRQALEHDRRCLLVLVHEMPDRLSWYAYAHRQDALDAAFASLGDPSIRWGINDDEDWLEYTNARQLAGLVHE